VPELVRLGAVSLDQGRHQAAHAAGPARRDPCIRSHQRWQAARRERSGHAGLGGRRVLLHDRGYLDFSRLYTLHQAGAFFVTRAKSSMDARRVYSATTDRTTGVLCDQRVMLNGYYSAKKYPEHVRRIRVKDPESGKTLVFLTNNMALPALIICALYKSRSQVELFFKWIKQHLRIKHFLGNSENAVKSQVWCAVATYVLIAIVKKQLHLEASLYTLLQILSVNIFEKMPLQQALTENAHFSSNLVDPNQLNLLGI
jgi:hypothetical protein